MPRNRAVGPSQIPMKVPLSRRARGGRSALLQNPIPATDVLVVGSCTTKGLTEMAKAENAWPAKKVKKKGINFMGNK
jgi:hypothetical protein